MNAVAQVSLVLGVMALGGCMGDDLASKSPLRGEIKVDGSSTVYLITEAMAANFKSLHPLVNISVGISGTGGGFKKFANGECDIADASRKIKPGEAENCKKNGIAFHEIQVAWDGLAVVIHPENTWARQMTVDQLRKIWHPESAVSKWSEVDPSWPNEPIMLYGAGPDSGTFDYFTEAVNGKEKVIRTDYTASEDDNTLVQGVSRNKYAIGFFGLAYYNANKTLIDAVAVAAKAGDPYILPSTETVLAGKYRPLSRPLFIYLRDHALTRPEIQAFTEFYLRRTDLVEASTFVPLSALQWWEQTSRLRGAIAQANEETP